MIWHLDDAVSANTLGAHGSAADLNHFPKSIKAKVSNLSVAQLVPLYVNFTQPQSSLTHTPPLPLDQLPGTNQHFFKLGGPRSRCALVWSGELPECLLLCWLSDLGNPKLTNENYDFIGVQSTCECRGDLRWFLLQKIDLLFDRFCLWWGWCFYKMLALQPWILSSNAIPTGWHRIHHTSEVAWIPCNLVVTCLWKAQWEWTTQPE